MDTRSVVERDGSAWLPSALAAGPFGGIHGGVIGGCMVTALAPEAAAALPGGELAVLNVQLLRPPALEPFEVETARVRSGRRAATLEARLLQDGREMARAQAVYATAAPIPGHSLPQLPPADPDVLPAPAADNAGSGPWQLAAAWFWHAFDVRLAADDTFWFRPHLALAPAAPATAMVVAVADWSSGLFRPDRRGTRRIAAWPNAELTVHLAVQANRIDPEGWFGVSGASHWNGLGWGFTGASLRDRDQALARSSQACILTPAENGP